MADQFILISDVQQTLKRNLFGPGWIHLGTAKLSLSNISKGGERFFMLLMHSSTSQTYIEEYVDFPEFFKKIEDNELWNDLYMFFIEKKLIGMGVGREFKIAKKE